LICPTRSAPGLFATTAFIATLLFAGHLVIQPRLFLWQIILGDAAMIGGPQNSMKKYRQKFLWFHP